MKIVLTHECNLHCFYCSDRWSRHKRQGHEHLEDSIEFLKTLPKLKKITLYGGEPLLHPNSEAAVARLVSEFPGKDLTIYTNGTSYPKWLHSYTLTFNVTYSSEPRSQNYRCPPNLVLKNLPRYRGKVILVEVIHPQFLDKLFETLVKDFSLVDSVELNIIRSHTDIGSYLPIFDEQLGRFVTWLAAHPRKNLSNFSVRPPNDVLFYIDYLQFLQGTFSDYENGIKNIVIDVDGKIYPATSTMGRGYAMGDIWGAISQDFELYHDAKQDCECENRYQCVPNYEHYNPEGKRLPFKNSSHCRYVAIMNKQMSEYYRLLEEGGYAVLPGIRHTDHLRHP